MLVGHSYCIRILAEAFRLSWFTPYHSTPSPHIIHNSGAHEGTMGLL